MRLKIYYRTWRSVSTTSGGSFDIETKAKEITELEAESQKDGFWNDNERAQGIMREISTRKEIVGTWQKVSDTLTNSEELILLAEEEGDEGKVEEILVSWILSSID